MAEYTMHVCDVCRLVNNDTTVKECVWCNFCHAYICKADLYRPDRRGIAMMKMWGNPVGLLLNKGVSNS